MANVIISHKTMAYQGSDDDLTALLLENTKHVSSDTTSEQWPEYHMTIEIIIALKSRQYASDNEVTAVAVEKSRQFPMTQAS